MANARRDFWIGQITTALLLVTAARPLAADIVAQAVVPPGSVGIALQTSTSVLAWILAFFWWALSWRELDTLPAQTSVSVRPAPGTVLGELEKLIAKMESLTALATLREKLQRVLEAAQVVLPVDDPDGTLDAVNMYLQQLVQIVGRLLVILPHADHHLEHPTEEAVQAEIQIREEAADGCLSQLLIILVNRNNPEDTIARQYAEELAALRGQSAGADVDGVTEDIEDQQ